MTPVLLKCSACGRPYQGYAEQRIYHGNCTHRKPTDKGYGPLYVVVENET